MSTLIAFYVSSQQQQQQQAICFQHHHYHHHQFRRWSSFSSDGKGLSLRSLLALSTTKMAKSTSTSTLTPSLVLVPP
ncbi:hypothetical protein HYC85_006606 [Camellia sinensis]|uniref:Uncharacterized protein n=1 Tax=Camellia sinensis TaxID=4442 RepID=A0A7J7HLJ5_CAMSI|nr:hypothetical protein HYC85_006606 [Camellia sinensis]